MAGHWSLVSNPFIPAPCSSPPAASTATYDTFVGKLKTIQLTRKVCLTPTRVAGLFMKPFIGYSVSLTRLIVGQTCVWQKPDIWIQPSSCQTSGMIRATGHLPPATGSSWHALATSHTTGSVVGWLLVDTARQHYLAKHIKSQYLLLINPKQIMWKFRAAHSSVDVIILDTN